MESSLATMSKQGGFGTATTSSLIKTPFKKHCDILESKVNIHRIEEALKSLSGVFTCPVAKMRTERWFRDQSFDVPEAIPDPNDNSDADDTPKADNADGLSAKAEVPRVTDERGLGNETFPGRDDALDKHGEVVKGRGSVRVRKGSTRPQQSRPSCRGLARPNRRRKLSRATSKSWQKSDWQNPRQPPPRVPAPPQLP